MKKDSLTDLASDVAGTVITVGPRTASEMKRNRASASYFAGG